MNTEQLYREVAMNVLGWSGRFYTIQLTGNDALLVIERMRELGFMFLCATSPSGFSAAFSLPGSNMAYDAYADSIPLAIFRAALKAVEATNG